MSPELKATLAVLRNAAGSGRGTLTLPDVEMLEALASLAEAQEVLLSGGRCSYCGHVDVTEDMPKHIATCPKHPMAALVEALEAVLLFHSGGTWDAAKAARWDKVAGANEATTKGLCTRVRAALALVKEGTP